MNNEPINDYYDAALAYWRTAWTHPGSNECVLLVEMNDGLTFVQSVRRAAAIRAFQSAASTGLYTRIALISSNVVMAELRITPVAPVEVEHERCPECGMPTIPKNETATHEERMCDDCFANYEDERNRAFIVPAEDDQIEPGYIGDGFTREYDYDHPLNDVSDPDESIDDQSEIPFSRTTTRIQYNSPALPGGAAEKSPAESPAELTTLRELNAQLVEQNENLTQEIAWLIMALQPFAEFYRANTERADGEVISRSFRGEPLLHFIKFRDASAALTSLERRAIRRSSGRKQGPETHQQVVKRW
jgi:hypothetical protein